MPGERLLYQPTCPLISHKDGEIVLRDEKYIVCVLCQGADEKTRVQPDTRNVLFYAYAVPGSGANFSEKASLWPRRPW